MEPIRIERYAQPIAGYTGCISPESGDWILWTPEEGDPVLFLRAEIEGDGVDVESVYVLASLVEDDRAFVGDGYLEKGSRPPGIEKD